MLYNLVENHARPAYKTAVKVQIGGLPKGQWSCAATAIAPGLCDPFVAWEKMGSPEHLTREQRAALLRASELPDPIPLPVRGNTIRVTMPGFSVMLLELKR